MKLYLHKFPGKLALMALLITQCFAFTPYTIPQGQWAKLASRTVTYTNDHSELAIDGLNENMDAVRVKVVKGAINLQRCVVYYKDSQTQDIDVLNSIPEGSESKIIELTRSGQPVTKVILVYDTKNRAIQKADVELWGRRN
jgi:hypothetical protein